MSHERLIEAERADVTARNRVDNTINDWQDVDEKGLLKRYPIEDGYVYAAFDWTHDSSLRTGGYWRMVNAFFVGRSG